MTKIPEYIPINPMTLVCPRCGAKATQACTILKGEAKLKGETEPVHIARIKAAATKDVARKKPGRK